MIYDIEDIKRLRKRLGITQHELSKRAEVSQSLIAKIESKKIDPTYTRVKKILTVLSDLEKKDQVTAERVMNNKIISLKPSAKIKEAIALMKKHNISQLPVMDQHNAVGLIAESDILQAVMEEKGDTVKDIMRESPPQVGHHINIDVISTLLRHSPMVVVTKQGKFCGVVTKSDLLGNL